MKQRRLIVGGVAAVALLLVFASYLRPDLARTLADQLWNCF
jgi:hypothetical protein